MGINKKTHMLELKLPQKECVYIMSDSFVAVIGHNLPTLDEAKEGKKVADKDSTSPDKHYVYIDYTASAFSHSILSSVDGLPDKLLSHRTSALEYSAKIAQYYEGRLSVMEPCSNYSTFVCASESIARRVHDIVSTADNAAIAFHVRKQCEVTEKTFDYDPHRYDHISPSLSPVLCFIESALGKEQGVFGRIIAACGNNFRQDTAVSYRNSVNIMVYFVSLGVPEREIIRFFKDYISLDTQVAHINSFSLHTETVLSLVDAGEFYKLPLWVQKCVFSYAELLYITFPELSVVSSFFAQWCIDHADNEEKMKLIKPAAQSLHVRFVDYSNKKMETSDILRLVRSGLGGANFLIARSPNCFKEKKCHVLSNVDLSAMRDKDRLYFFDAFPFTSISLNCVSGANIDGIVGTRLDTDTDKAYQSYACHNMTHAHDAGNVCDMDTSLRVERLAKDMGATFYDRKDKEVKVTGHTDEYKDICDDIGVDRISLVRGCAALYGYFCARSDSPLSFDILRSLVSGQDVTILPR